VCGRYGQFARSWIALYMVIPNAFSLSAPNVEESRTRFMSALRKSRERRVRTRIVQLDHYSGFGHARDRRCRTKYRRCDIVI